MVRFLAVLSILVVAFAGSLHAADIYTSSGDAFGGSDLGEFGLEDSDNLHYAEFDQDGFRDIRLSYGDLPDGDTRTYGTKTRISLMAIGPLCSIVPVNCYTPSRLGNADVPPAHKRWGRRRGYNFLMGFELSSLEWSDYEDVNATNEQIEITAVAGTFHVFGLGFEFGAPLRGRLQVEMNPFVGIGQASFDYAGPVVRNSDDGLMFEYGFRAGVYYTMSFGLQVGFEGRYSGMSFDFSNFNGDDEASGGSYAFSLGYRL